MPIPFSTISNTVRTPGRYTEFDSSGAVQGAPAEQRRTLLAGTRLAGGTAANATVYRILSDAQAETLFGMRSPLAAMVRAFRSIHPGGELYATSVAEDAAGVAAAGTFALTGTATEAGTVAIYVGDRRYAAAVTVGMTAAATASALATRMAADDRRYADGVAATGTLTVTVTHKGPAGNELELAHSLQPSERIPAGLALTVTQPTAGATAPDVTALIAGLDDTQYHCIATNISDATNIGRFETELAARWGGEQQIDGQLFVAKNLSYADLLTFGAARNSPHSTVLETKDSLTPPWIAAGLLAALYAREPHPARPYTGLALAGMVGATPSARLIREERDALLASGISTTITGPDGTVRVERLITTYRTNPLGASDPSMLDLHTMRNLSNIRWRWNTRTMNKWPRHILSDNDKGIGPGQPIVTPDSVRAEAIAEWNDLRANAQVENFEQFLELLAAERDSTDANRLNVFMAPNVTNALYVLATNVGFRL